MFTNRTTTIACGSCEGEIAAVLDSAVDLATGLYAAGSDVDGPVAVAVVPFDPLLSPDPVEWEAPPDGLMPAELVAASNAGAGTEITDPAVAAWLRARRATLIARIPEGPYEFIGVESDGTQYQVYFRDLAEGESASTGAFDQALRE